MDINFEYYKIFYYAAKYGNLTKAAGVLKSNQPNVSRVIKILESQLNCRLFIRSSKGITLTEEGRQLYRHVEIACQHLLGAQAELRCRETECRGSVEIGVTETALHLFLLSRLHGFHAAYPEIRLKIQNSTTPELLKGLVGGKTDFAVVTTPFASSAGLRCEKMMEFEEILVGGTEYAAAAREGVKLRRLCRYSLIGLGSGTATYEFYRDLFARHRMDFELDMEVAASDLMLPLIQNNLGIGFVAEPMARPLIQKGEILRIGLDVSLPVREVQMVWDKGRGRSGAADALRRYLQDKGPGQPGIQRREYVC